MKRFFNRVWCLFAGHEPVDFKKVSDHCASYRCARCGRKFLYWGDEGEFHGCSIPLTPEMEEFYARRSAE